MALTPEQRRELIRKANEARRHAYAPYSGYAVGAALLTADGRIFSGVNVENASYPNGVCAERVAIYKAVSEGARDFQAIAVVTENGGSPCGFCRQVMAEFNPQMIVLIANAQEELIMEVSLETLLPYVFVYPYK
ncbi:cytidine deaminase [Caldilinea sp.]|jgi:cytidine deaminase|uniref:cytidine deaminase n=1 Tax=Caldilinea sp. TaxID=2293560 RepID=UPI001B054614|nr:cytidine deaminase [Caldilinea sp.]MBO9394972.1 cytidine deaminase [Caldilinea sp.]